MKKRILSLVLTLAFLFACLPALSGDARAENTYGYTLNVASDDCVTTETLALSDTDEDSYVCFGESTLDGRYAVEAVSGGYTVYNTETNKYIAYNASDKKVVEADNVYTWGYDGGLYVLSSTYAYRSFTFWRIPTASYGTKWYLTIGKADFELSSVKVCVTRKTETVHKEGHQYTKYICENGAEHSRVCSVCGKETTEEHSFNSAGRCTCGAYNRSKFEVKVGAKITKVVATTTARGFYWFRSNTRVTYKVSIDTSASTMPVKSVSYSLNDETYTVGTSFTVGYKVKVFYVKVVDANGDETVWQYDDGSVTKRVGCYVCEMLYQSCRAEDVISGDGLVESLDNLSDEERSVYYAAQIVVNEAVADANTQIRNEGYTAVKMDLKEYADKMSDAIVAIFSAFGCEYDAELFKGLTMTVNVIDAVDGTYTYTIYHASCSCEHCLNHELSFALN